MPGDVRDYHRGREADQVALGRENREPKRASELCLVAKVDGLGTGSAGGRGWRYGWTTDRTGEFSGRNDSTIELCLQEIGSA